MKRGRAFLVLLCLGVASDLRSATTNWVGPGSDWNTAGNWSAGIPNDNAAFNSATPTAIAFDQPGMGIIHLNTFTFNPGASAYTITLGTNTYLFLEGSGIVNNSVNTQTIVIKRTLELGGPVTGSVTLNNDGYYLHVYNGASLASATVYNLRGQSELGFYDTSSAANAHITNSGTMFFRASSTASSSTITNAGSLAFHDSATGGRASISNLAGSTITLHDTSSLGTAAISNSGLIDGSAITSSTWTAGSISGAGAIKLGAKNLTIGGNDASTTLSGVISGTNGSLTKVGNGTLTLSGANTFTGLTTISEGAIELTGSLGGDVTVGPHGNFTATGTIGRLVNNGSVALGSGGLGTLTTFNYSGAGEMEVGFNGVSHGHIVVTGSADITDGTLSLLGSQLAVGRYTVLTAGALTGTLSSLISPSPLLSLTPQYSSTDLDVWIHFATPFSSYAQTSNQSQLAANLESRRTTSTPEFTNRILSLAQLAAPDMAAAMSQVSGDALASFQAVGFQTARLFTKGIHDRSVHVSSESYGIWSQAVGGLETLKADAALGSPESKSTTGGFQAGYDTFVNDNMLVGFSGGYARTSLNVPDRASSGDSKSVQSGLYAAYTQWPWFANGSVAHIGGIHSMHRGIRYGSVQDTANSDFRSWMMSTYAEAGYFLHQTRHMDIQPVVSLRHTYLDQGRFVETKASGLGLAVSRQTVHSWTSHLGTHVARRYRERQTRSVDLDLEVAWELEMGTTRDKISAHFNEAETGTDFTVEGTPRSRNAAVAGLQASVPLRPDLIAAIQCHTRVASSETEHALLGSLRYTW